MKIFRGLLLLTLSVAACLADDPTNPINQKPPPGPPPAVPPTGEFGVDDVKNDFADPLDVDMPEGLIAQAVRADAQAGIASRRQINEDNNNDDDLPRHDPMVGLGNHDGTPGPLLYKLNIHGGPIDVRTGDGNLTLAVVFNVRGSGEGPSDLVSGLEQKSEPDGGDDGTGGEEEEVRLVSVHAHLTHVNHTDELEIPCVDPFVEHAPFTCTFVVPRHAHAGKWTIKEIGMHDNLGRMTHLTTEDLRRARLQPFVEVISDTDDQGPELVSLELSARKMPVSESDGYGVPHGVDPSGEALFVVARLRISDSLSGFMFGEIRLVAPDKDGGGSEAYHGPSGDEKTITLMIGEHNRLTGDHHDGTYVAREHVHRHSPAGMWRVQEVVLRDAVGNTVTLDATRLQVSKKLARGVLIETESDHDPPELVRLRVLTPKVSTGSVAKFEITSDDPLAGTAHIVVIVTNSGLVHDIIDGATPPGGITVRGESVMTVSMRIPPGAPLGTYTIRQVLLIDEVNNRSDLSTDKIGGMGFDTSFEVVAPMAPEDYENEDASQAHTEL